MKALLEFDLTEPEERLEHLQCVQARNAFSVLREIQEYVNFRRYKYDDPKSDAHYEECESISEEVNRMIKINLHDESFE